MNFYSEYEISGTSFSKIIIDFDQLCKTLFSNKTEILSASKRDKTLTKPLIQQT